MNTIQVYRNLQKRKEKMFVRGWMGVCGCEYANPPLGGATLPLYKCTNSAYAKTKCVTKGKRKLLPGFHCPAPLYWPCDTKKGPRLLSATDKLLTKLKWTQRQRCLPNINTLFFSAFLLLLLLLLLFPLLPGPHPFWLLFFQVAAWSFCGRNQMLGNWARRMRRVQAQTQNLK